MHYPRAHGVGSRRALAGQAAKEDDSLLLILTAFAHFTRTFGQHHAQGQCTQ